MEPETSRRLVTGALVLIGSATIPELASNFIFDDTVYRSEILIEEI
jgi:hypothetical protein